MGPPQGAGRVANAIWGRITPCCFAASRSNESPLIDSAGPVCGQQRSNDRLVRSAWSHPLAFASTRLACTPALLPQVPSGRYSARLNPSAADHFACTHRGAAPPWQQNDPAKNNLPGWNRTTSRPDYSRALSHLSYCQFPGPPARLRRYPDGSNWRVAQCPPF